MKVCRDCGVNPTPQRRRRCTGCQLQHVRLTRRKAHSKRKSAWYGRYVKARLAADPEWAATYRMKRAALQRIRRLRRKLGMEAMCLSCTLKNMRRPRRKAWPQFIEDLVSLVERP